VLNDKSEIVNNNGDCLIPRLTLLFLSSPLGRPPVSETRALTRFARSLRAHVRSRFDASVESSSWLRRRHGACLRALRSDAHAIAAHPRQRTSVPTTMNNRGPQTASPSPTLTTPKMKGERVILPLSLKRSSFCLKLFVTVFHIGLL
jgi:hypothetical protein